MSELSPALQAKLLQLRVELAIAQTQQVRVAHTLVDLVLSWVAWRSGAEQAVLIYLPLMTISHLSRSALLQRLLVGGHHQPQRLLRLSMLALAYLGLLKGVLSLAVFAQPASTWQELYTVVLIGNAAGAVSTAAGHLRTYLAWAIPFGAGLVLGWLMRGGVEGVAMALLVVALFSVLCGYVREQGAAQVRQLRLTESLREARDRAERASESRTRFFAAASHDLRQPLTALSYGVASVEALAQLREDPQLQKIGGSLRRSLTDSQALLDSLLEVSQLDAGAVEARREALPLAPLIADLVGTLRPMAEHRGLQLRAEELDPALVTLADPTLLRRVLQNLIGNALKFTPSGGEVRVRLRLRGLQLQIDVIDNGPGIAPELQERVFEEFFQVGNTQRDRSHGLGLGLSIVRRLVALMGLELRLESEPGRGCHFTLILPRSADLSPEAAPTPVTTLSPGEALQLLLVDDEAPIRESLGQLLGALGWTLRSAASGSEALALLQDGWQPQALLLDYRLRDGETGLDVLDSLRQAGCTAPAWLVTGDTAPQRIQQAQRQLGAGLQVIYKPVDGLALAAAIRAGLSSGPAAG